MPEDESKRLARCRRLAKFRQYLATFIANIMAFAVGAMLGWTSPMQPLLSSEHPPIGSEPIQKDFISWLGSINFLGAVFGTLFWGVSSDRLGRKFTLLIVAFPFIICWIMKLTAPNKWWLLAARVIIGVGCSGVVINVPIYVAEMAENNIRGSLGCFLMIFLNSGCVFSYIVGSLTSYYVLSAACLSIPIVFLLCFPFMPESPVFLWTQGKREKAEKSLLWFRGGNMTQTMKELEMLKERPGKPLETPTYRDLFSTRGVRKAMFLSLGVVLGQQFCGILAILTYTVDIFRESGSSLSPYVSTIIVGALQLVFAIVSSFVIDRAGRKLLLGFSFVSMSLALVTLSGYLYFHDESWSPTLGWVPIISLSVNVISYAIGVGTVPFVIMSEIFPPDIRGFATSKIQLVGTSLSFVTVKTFPFLTQVLGIHGCFLLYAVGCALQAVFTFTCIPETKGKSLQYILKLLNGEDVTKSGESEYSELFQVQKATIVKSV